jgi:hypothetical protein
MDADDGVNACDGFAADVTACQTSVGGLFVARVDGFKALEEGLELRGEAFIRFYLANEQRVAPGIAGFRFRQIEDEEECCAGGVYFVGDITVPCNGGDRLKTTVGGTGGCAALGT